MEHSFRSHTKCVGGIGNKKDHKLKPPCPHRYKLGNRIWHRDDKLFDEEGHATDLITDEAIRVIRSPNKKPFFL